MTHESQIILIFIDLSLHLLPIHLRYIHNLYHLHSSVHLGLVLVAELSDGTKYGIWIIVMTTSLEVKNNIRFLDGSIVKSDENDPYCKIWSRCNNMVSHGFLTVFLRRFIRVSCSSKMLLIYGRTSILVFISQICQDSTNCVIGFIHFVKAAWIYLHTILRLNLVGRIGKYSEHTPYC